MALPSLNATPSYELTVPSSGQKLKYRPFLVKEQKILMLAYESQDKKHIINAMIDTLKGCVTDIDITKLATFDVDYIFTQIRAKSVGEKIEIKLPCSECETPNPLTVNLEDINIDVKENEKVVKLTDQVSVKLKYPTYVDFITRIGSIDNKTQTETIMEIIISCMDSVMTEEENISLKDETREEIEKFIDSMNSKQFEEVSEFVQNMPQMTYTHKMACINCGHEEEKTLRGLDDFF